MLVLQAASCRLPGPGYVSFVQAGSGELCAGECVSGLGFRVLGVGDIRVSSRSPKPSTLNPNIPNVPSPSCCHPPGPGYVSFVQPCSGELCAGECGLGFRVSGTRVSQGVEAQLGRGIRDGRALTSLWKRVVCEASEALRVGCLGQKPEALNHQPSTLTSLTSSPWTTISACVLVLQAASCHLPGPAYVSFVQAGSGELCAGECV